jgi:hypothetical protein
MILCLDWEVLMFCFYHSELIKTCRWSVFIMLIFWIMLLNYNNFMSFDKEDSDFEVCLTSSEYTRILSVEK